MPAKRGKVAAIDIPPPLDEVFPKGIINCVVGVMLPKRMPILRIAGVKADGVNGGKALSFDFALKIGVRGNRILKACGPKTSSPKELDATGPAQKRIAEIPVNFSDIVVRTSQQRFGGSAYVWASTRYSYFPKMSAARPTAPVLDRRFHPLLWDQPCRPLRVYRRRAPDGP